MRDYSVFRSRFWTGETGRALRGNADAQLLAVYLFTCQHANLIGLYYLPLAYASHETGMPADRVSAAMDTLSAAGFADYDTQTEHVWVVSAARQQTTRSPKSLGAARGELSKTGSWALRVAFENRYGHTLEWLHSDRVSIGYPPRSLLQNQDQEQDRNRNSAVAPCELPAQEPENDQGESAITLVRRYYSQLLETLATFPPHGEKTLKAYAVIAKWAEQFPDQKAALQAAFHGFEHNEWATKQRYPITAMATGVQRYHADGLAMLEAV